MIPAISTPALPGMNAEQVAFARAVEAQALEAEQVDIKTVHVLHAGMYARTIKIPAGVMITGVLVKIPTLLTISGHATVYVGREAFDFDGYHTLPASAGRKQIFIAYEDTYLTMIFPSAAKTVAEAESEFTDEWELLASNKSDSDIVIITGEAACQA